MPLQKKPSSPENAPAHPAALRKSEDMYRHIFENSGVASAVIGDDGTFSLVNTRFEQLSGYTRGEILGKKNWKEFVVPDDLHLPGKSGGGDELPGDSPVRREVQFVRRDGEARTALLTINRIPGTQYLVIAVLDITDKNRSGNAVRLANRKLNFLNGIIRHDILNQLTVLKGSLDMARDEVSDPDQRLVLEREITAADAIQMLITFTRDYQDIGMEPPEWQGVKQAVMRSCAGIRLGDVSLSVEIGGLEIYADRLLPTVFTSLVKNAIHHGGKTTRIRIFCRESSEGLCVICEDDGVGVPPEEKEKIFGRRLFSKGGTGLYLAQEILSITAITIRENGVHGSGARFEIRVPRGGYRFIAEQGPTR